MYEKYKWLGLLLTFFMLASCAILGDRSLSISETDVQQKLNERLAIPFTLLKIFDVNLSNAEVRFDKDTGRMHTTFDAKVGSQLTRQTLPGKLAVSGKLRFDAETGSVVLDEAQVDNLRFDGMNEQFADLLNALAKTVGAEMLSGLPLYTVKSEELKIGSTQYYPKNMQITDSGLLIILSPSW